MHQRSVCRTLPAAGVSASVALAIVFATQTATGQTLPTYEGIVVDSATGAGVAGAEVVVGHRRTSTDAQGTFMLEGARPGSDTLRVRRLGFRASTMLLTERTADERVRVVLAALPHQLDPIVVHAKWEGFTGRLAGYYHRLSRGATGQFITRADLDGERTGLLTNVLQRVPGIQVRRGPGGPELSMRGRNCRPLVWVDGVAVRGEVDLDAFSPSSLHGVELYFGAVSAPLRFHALKGMSECGTILLWSRGADTDPVGSPPDASPEALQRLIAARSIYTADEVDRTARAADGVRVEYPQLLRAMNVRGSIVAEFIVDTNGVVEPESFSVVMATDRRFADGVRRALQQTRFRPAERGGQRVRQLVRQRFEFGMPTGDEAVPAKHMSGSGNCHSLGFLCAVS